MMQKTAQIITITKRIAREKSDCVRMLKSMLSLTLFNRISIFLSLIILSISCTTQDYKPIDCLKEAYDKLAADSIGEAYISAERALQGFYKSHDSLGEMRTKVFIALLYYITDQNNEAIKLLKTIDSHQLKLADQGDYQNFLRLSSWYAGYNNDCENAVAFADSLISLDLKIGDIDEIMLDNLNKVEILTNCNNFDLADRLLDSIGTEINDSMVAAPFYYARKSYLLYLEGNMREAKRFAEIAIGLYNEETPDQVSQLTMRRILMEADSIEGNLIGYANNRNLLQKEQDVLRGEKVDNHIALLKASEDLERTKIENQIQEQKYLYTLIFAFLIAAILIILIVWRYRSLVAKHEITSLTLKSLDLEVFRFKMKNELLSDKVKALNEKIAQAHDLLAHINPESDNESQNAPSLSYLDRLKILINENYGEDIKRAREKFPNLTANDELLIGFVKLNLTTNEIASALNIEPRSLIKARYRLRKKLGVENADDLNDFIRAL